MKMIYKKISLVERHLCWGFFLGQSDLLQNVVSDGGYSD